MLSSELAAGRRHVFAEPRSRAPPPSFPRYRRIVALGPRRSDLCAAMLCIFYFLFFLFVCVCVLYSTRLSCLLFLSKNLSAMILQEQFCIIVPVLLVHYLQ